MWLSSSFIAWSLDSRASLLIWASLGIQTVFIPLVMLYINDTFFPSASPYDWSLCASSECDTLSNISTKFCASLVSSQAAADFLTFKPAPELKELFQFYSNLSYCSNIAKWPYSLVSTVSMLMFGSFLTETVPTKRATMSLVFK